MNLKALGDTIQSAASKRPPVGACPARMTPNEIAIVGLDFVITKPFTYQGLAQKIAGALDAGRRPGSACG